MGTRTRARALFVASRVSAPVLPPPGRSVPRRGLGAPAAPAPRQTRGCESKGEKTHDLPKQAVLAKHTHSRPATTLSRARASIIRQVLGVVRRHLPRQEGWIIPIPIVPPKLDHARRAGIILFRGFGGMRCGDPLPRAFDFGSLTAEPAKRCSRLPTGAGLRALEWPFGLRPWITPRQFSATATSEKDKRPGGARNRCERDLDAGQAARSKVPWRRVATPGRGTLCVLGISHLQTPSSHSCAALRG